MDMKKKAVVGLCVTCVFLSVVAGARALEYKSFVKRPDPVTDVPRDKPSVRDRNLDDVEKESLANLEAYAKNPDVLVRYGLLANRKKKIIQIAGETTGVSGHEPTEFLLIHLNSGHNYESVALSLALPSDVRDAIRFIGMEPGRHADADRHQFWPKGERLIMTFSCDDPKHKFAPTRAEGFVWDHERNAPMEESGFIFTGGYDVPAEEDGAAKIFAADKWEPNSISSTYNERQSVLDIPWFAPQKAVYRQLGMHPKHALPAGVRLNIALEPEYKDGKKRVEDVTLRLVLDPNAVAPSGIPPEAARLLEGIRFDCLDPEGKLLTKKPGLDLFIDCCNELVKDGHDPFVTLDVDPAIPVTRMSAIAAILRSVESEKGIRVEPPKKGQLFYQAYLPEPGFRNRSKHFVHPWELSLKKENGTVVGRLTRVISSWDKKAGKSTYSFDHYDVANAKELKKTIDPIAKAVREDTESIKPYLAAILVFVDSSFTCGDVATFVGSMLDTHPIIYVFVEQ
jgi:hypothetical protein